MKQLIVTCTFLLGLQTYLFSQTIPETIVHDSSTVYEKLYLHIDRELYQPGDDIWFKSYLVSGINHKLIPGFKNVCVQLLAEDGEIIDQLLMLSMNGAANNDFKLPDTIPKGSYTIRGYTKYLQNFGEESLFHQKIAVASSTDLPDFEDEAEKPAIIDVSFLAEGGSFVLNAANHIAFKAIDEKGRGVPVSGKVVDETGAEIVSFQSRYKGMSTFMLMPKEGKKYTAKIDGYPDFSYEFEAPQFDGIALHYTRKEQELMFTLSRNIKSTTAKELVFVASQKGKELFREEFEMTGFQYPLNIYKGFFPQGISKVTVLDERENVLAERLIFLLEENEELIKITSDKDKYATRDSIELVIETLLEDDSILTGISLAVVNEDYFSEGGRSQSMQSYLLLDSELKGPLESPADCFFDSENITSEEKLDLVMQVYGWRRYYWDELDNYFGKPLPGWDDAGLTISGRVKRLFKDEWVEGGTVELGPFSSHFLILKDTTDEAGQFSFERLYLKDSALIMINAENSKGSNRVEIIEEIPAVFDSLVPAADVMNTSNEIYFTEQFQQSSYNRHLAEREFELEHGSILLKDVEVKAKKLTSPPTVAGVYGFPNRAFELSDADRSYYNILEYLQFEVAGISVFEDGIRTQVRIGFAKANPTFFVDGLGIDMNQLITMSMKDMQKVEIFSRNFLLELASGKPNGGVVSILTKSGFRLFDDTFDRIIQGRITPYVKGFKQAREFYSPTYPLENDSLNRPDQRPTLYWNPIARPQNGEVKVKFFASDMVSRYRIIAEGISNEGKICFGMAKFDVVVPEEE